MAGYTRQSRPDITNGADITAPPINAEFDQIETAFGTGGHTHDGTSGNAPKIDLTTSVVGYLEAINGGVAGKNNVSATSNPTITDDTGAGYAPGSIWLNTATNRVFICLSNTSSAAAWHEIVAVNTASNIVPENDATVDLGTLTKRFKDLLLSGDATVGGNIAVIGTATVSGAATFENNVQINGTLDVDGAATLDASLSVAGDVTISGATNLNGNTVIGDASTDTVSVNAQLNTSLVPSSTNARDLGAVALEFRDLFIDGTAHIDTLDVDENAAIIGTLNVSGNTTLQGTLNTGAITGTSANYSTNLDVSGTSTLATVDINSGAIDGTAIGAVSHSTGKFTTIESTGIATLATVNIDGGAIDDTAIGFTTPSSGAFTTLQANAGITGDLTGQVTHSVGTSSFDNITASGTITGNITGDVTGNVTAATGSSSFNDVTVNGTLDVTGTTIANVTDPVLAQDAATKNYVDAADALKLDLAGGTLSGALAMGTNKITGLGTPTATTDAATKGYVDQEVSAVIDSAPGALDTLNELAAALGDDANFSTTVTNNLATKLPLAGGTMSGDIVLGANKATSTAVPATADTLTRKGYVDDQDDLKLDLTGGTMTGAIAMGTSKITGLGDPTANQDAATKAYVDTQDGLKVSKTGDTMSGALAMGSNNITGLAAPTATDHAATKGYTDSILGSATAASTSAAAALTSENNAATSEQNAATSATAAASAKQDAESALDDFTDIYLGAFASAPTVDNDGDALQTGAIYYNTTSGSEQLYVYDGSNWQQAAFTLSQALANLVEDTTPELGGDLDLNSNSIIGTGGINITGDVAVTGNVDGRDVAADGTKLDGIESGATADQTAAEILTAIKTVDGAGSGLDADTLDGNQATAFYLATNPNGYTTNTGTVTSAGITVPTGFSVSGSPITTSGTFAVSYATGYQGYTSSEATKLAGIETGATADQTASEILTAIKTVDGSGSGLDADLLDGLDLHTGRNNQANKVVRTQGNGYAEFGWINTTSGDTSAGLSRAYVDTGDGYIRKCTLSHLRSQMGAFSTSGGTISGDLTVNGGDIVLGGTGRIQGIDTVSSGTDAASKTYVDTAVAGAGSITGAEDSVYQNISIGINSAGTNNTYYGQRCVIIGDGAADSFNVSNSIDNVWIGAEIFSGDSIGAFVSNTVAIGSGVSRAGSQGGGAVVIGKGAKMASSTIAVGYNTLSSGSTTSQRSVLIGTECAQLSRSTDNVAIGYQAFRQFGTTNNAYYTTAIGRQAGKTEASGNNNTCIGYNSTSSSSSATNQFTLGNSSTSNLRCNDTSISGLSDSRDKTDVQDIAWGLDFINALRPVSFTWDRRDGSMGNTKQLGFIAQEVHEVELRHSSSEYSKMVDFTNPQKLELAANRSYPILVKAVQELSAKIEELEARLATLEGS